MSDKAKSKLTKTNAMRLIEAARVSYISHEYDTNGALDGISVAQKIGKSVDIVYKTLVTKGAKTLHVFIIPVNRELDLKAAAKAVEEKALAMLPVCDLLLQTGYVKGGCSPVGMKKLYSTVVDQRASALDTMIVSAGKIGQQVELHPQDLVHLTKAKYAEVTYSDAL